MDYCIAHPTDAEKCISSNNPSKLPPLPKPTGPTVPFTPLTEEQKQLANGTYRPPKGNIPPASPVEKLEMKPITADISPVRPSNSTESLDTSSGSRPNYEPSCDASCQKTTAREDFKEGYAVGQALGTAVGNSITTSIEIQRKHKLCKENPTANWKYEDGSVATCESINSNHEVRVLPASPELRSQLRSNADQARDLMEGIRQDVVRFQSQDAGAAWLPSTLRQLQTSWSDLRDMFCGYYKNAEYIDLDGKTHNCDGHQVKNSVLAQPSDLAASAVKSRIQMTTSDVYSPEKTNSSSSTLNESRPADESPSLQETLNWMFSFIELHGMISGKVVTSHDPWTEDYRVVRRTHISAADNCSIRVEERGTWLGGIDMTVPLGDIDPQSIEVEDSEIGPSGTKILYLVSFFSTKFTIRLDGEFSKVGTDKIGKTLLAHHGSIRFMNKDDANRFANALKHASEVCGAKASTF